MRVAPGTRLGGYEVVSQLGAGGMGEVYRAHDAALNRDVAVKIVHPQFCGDPERVARFRREARALAALNHPHVAVIHDFDECDGVCFLVMELVPGETLERKLSREALAVPEALRLASQIAAAIEAAHEKGIVHRDLKPANIKVTADGIVKVLDFGLAKALDTDGTLSRSPTAGTDEGIILGTAAYMSPEQARGKPADRRTDIWAFGCVLYEALTSRGAFGGATISDTLVQILEREPDWTLLPADTPEAVLRLLRRCLTKDAYRRLRDIGDARLEIEEALHAPPQAAARIEPPARIRGRGFQMLAPLAVGVLAGTGIAVLVQTDPTPTARPAAHFVVPLSPDEPLAGLDFPAVAVSPDGSQLVYVAARGGRTHLVLRPMGGITASPIAGTAEAIAPFFSPDSRWVGFFAGGTLKKVPVSGGPPVTLCDAPIGFGGSWGNGDTIVFSSTTGSPLFQVSAAGGTPERITTLDDARGEFSHRWPELLPDGKTVLFTVGTLGSWDDAQIVAQRLGSGERRVLIEGGTNPRYVPTGHLLYARAGAMMGVPFDAARLTVSGSPVRVLENVLESFDGAAQLSVSRAGALVYVPGNAHGASRRFVGLDASGAPAPFAAPPRAYAHPRVSPDGRRLVATIAAVTEDVWAYDIAEGALKQLTFEADNSSPIWTADGRWVTFSSNRGGARNLYRVRADGSGAAERLTSSDSIHLPGSWSPDGTVLAFVEHHPATGRDIWMLEAAGAREATPFVRTSFDESAPRFSPDGRSVAYVSNESGRSEVYVQAFSDPSRKWRVSTDGGSEPVWAHDGRELFYRSGDRLMAVNVAPGGEFRAAARQALFDLPFEKGTFDGANFDVMPGGRRFVFVRNIERAPTEGQLHVVVNWLERLPSLMSQ